MARILVIDDDSLARITLRMVLEGQGHEIYEAENGNEGIVADARYHATLIITDLIMPEKEGGEAIRHFREHRPSVPIIAISGGGRLSDNAPLDAARKLGANHILTKPISNCDLIAAVDDCLARTSGA